MGLIGKIAEIVAGEAAIDVADSALNKIEKKIEERENKLFEKKSENDILVIQRYKATRKDQFDVFDENREVKYTVKGKSASVKHHLRIYDAKGKELGRVKEKLISLRSPFSFEYNPVDYIIEINGEKRGKIKSRRKFGKQKYEVKFNGWRIEGNIVGWNFKILNGNDIIGYISKHSINQAYVVEFPDKENELLILMLVIALYAANGPSKQDRNERARKHRRRSRFF